VRTWSLGPGAIGAGRDVKFEGPVDIRVAVGAADRLTDKIFDRSNLAEQLDLSRFTGRADLIRRIDEFIAGNDRGYVLVRAEAGVGKSALAAHLVWTRPCAYHFTKLDGARSPEEARMSLAAQLIGGWNLAERFVPNDAFPPGATRPDWFGNVLRAAARQRDLEQTGQPLVLVVDGLDEADDVAASSTGVPLGLPTPENLPPGVYVVATSRFGPPLTALTDSDRCLTIPVEVDSADNVQDMRDYLAAVLAGPRADPKLVEALSRAQITPEDFAEALLARCGGVWIYMKCVLDEVRVGRRDPTDVASLPRALRGYYWREIDRWARDTAWVSLRRPTLAALVAFRRPVTVAELARLTGAEPAAVSRWLNREMQAFLNVTRPVAQGHGQPGGGRRYAIRHGSLRDLLTTVDSESGNRDGGPAEEFHAAVARAHADITDFLVPAGPPEQRDWTSVDTYTRISLAEHAAAAGQLDDLMTDPGFLLSCQPDSILRQRHRLTRPTAVAAAQALEAVLDEWGRHPDHDRVWWLHVWARKTQAAQLAIAAARRSGRAWTVHAAMWAGTAHRALVGQSGAVLAVAGLRLADGRTWLASGCADGTVRLWDPETGTAVGRPLTGHVGWVRAVAAVALPGGRSLLASGGDDGVVRLWTMAAAGPMAAASSVLTGHEERVLAVAAVPLPGRRTLLASGGDDGTVRLWDPLAGTAVGRPLDGHGGPVRVLATVPLAGGVTLLASGGDDRTVRLWDPLAGTAVGRPLTGHQNWVRSMAVVGPAGGRTLLASGGDDGTVRLWDPLAGTVVGRPLTGHVGSIKAMAAVELPDGSTVLATGGDDEQIRLWDPEVGNAVGRPLDGHSRVINAAASIPLPDGRVLLATGGADETVRLWDPSIRTSVETPLAGHHRAIEAAAAAPVEDGREVLATAGTDGTVRLWDPMTRTAVGRPLEGHVDWVLAVASVRQGDGRRLLATGGTDGTVRRWDPSTGNAVGQPLLGHTGWVLAVTAVRVRGGAGTGDLVATGGDDSVIRLWDPNTGTQIGEPLVGHAGAVRALAAVPMPEGGTLLASGGDDLTIRLWDPLVGRQVGEPLTGHQGWIRAMAVVPMADGRVLLGTGADDRTLRLWDPVQAAAVGEPMVGHWNTVTAVAAVPVAGGDPGVVLASGSRDGTVRLWDPVRRAPLGDPLFGHSGWVRTAVAVRQRDGGAVLVTAGDDSAVLVWGPGVGRDP